MRAQRAAEKVISVGNVGYPVAQRFVDRVLERSRTGIHFAHLGAQQFHAENIQRLAAHVFGAHVNDAVQSKQRANCCRRHAMLSGAGLGDHPALVHASCQQNLAQRVVDFVGAGVQQVFALEINLRAAGMLG